MASNTTEKSSEEETITCSICQNILENPRRLDCLHSFCDRCLRNVDRVIEKANRGILCPLCRKFTSELHIKKDPILEVLVEAFSQFYDKNILNKDPMEKFCNQCDTRINVTSYCVACDAELCQTCKTRHLRFEAMSEHRIVPISEAGTHPVVNVTKYCPKHVTKPIKLSCIPCKLAICLECKVEDHDTHKTEDVPSALASVLPELRTSISLLNAEKWKQIKVKHDLVSLVREVTSLEKEILGNIEKTRDELISCVMSDCNKMKETLTNFFQSVTKEASLREDDANNSISSIDSMSSWIKVLADITEGPAVLFEVRNERLLERLRALLTECEVSRDVRELQSRATKKPIFTQTPLQCDNVVGSIQFEEPSAMFSEECGVSGLYQPYTSSPHSLATKQTPGTKQKTKHEACTVSTKQSTINVKSFRHTKNILCELKVGKKKSSFQLEEVYPRFCYHEESLWCPCSNTIHIYTLDGQLQRSVDCPEVLSISALHPVTPTIMLLSAESGLYTYDTTQHAVNNTLREGQFLDVHASGTHIVALEKKSGTGNLVHVFSTTYPPTNLYSFSVTKTDALCVLVHDQCVYVSARKDSTSVSVYTVEGQIISQNNYYGVSKPLKTPSLHLCAVDFEGSLLIADHNSKQLQIMDREGQFSVVKGVGVQWLSDVDDVAIVGKDLFVLLHRSYPGSKIQRYELY